MYRLIPSLDTLQFKRTARSPSWSTAKRGREGQPRRARAAHLCRSRAGHSTAITPTANGKLPSAETFHSVPTLVDALCREMRQARARDERRWSVRIHTTRVQSDASLNLYKALLIPCASLLTVSRTINFLFKVLFIFPSRYLFAIGLVPVFSFRRSLPPILGCIPKQPDS